MATIQLKRSSIPGKVPLPSDLTDGEVAVNMADGTAFLKNSAGTVVLIGAKTKADVGLGSVDNTSDADKPVSTAQQTAINARIASTEKGAANGVAPLDGSGKVDVSFLPAIAITDTFVVADQAAMLALTAQVGDVAVRDDLSKSFILQASPASTLANWIELKTPSDAVSSVAGKTGAVTLVKGDVGLGNVDNTSDANKPVSTAQQTALNLKANLAGPTFTGTPAAPTAAPGTNTTQIATTAFVQAAMTGAVGTIDGGTF